MVEFRYHRVATNDAGWLRPIGGRLGSSTDYVGTRGFGHEDWNFTKEIWEDGKCHLYLQGSPASADRHKEFNIALGVWTPAGHLVVGFCENATIAISELDDEVWMRRAYDLQMLEENEDLGLEWVGVSPQTKAGMLRDGSEVFEIAVHPNRLLVLDTPIQVPADIISPKYHRYQMRKMTPDQYESLAALANRKPATLDAEEALFPEGAPVAKLHRSRERNSALVMKAKQHFIQKHGSLFCECCGWAPENAFQRTELANTIIEAHHDIPLGAPEHGGETRLSDLKMLCPNCHRAIHFMRPWKKVSELKTEISR